MPQEAFGDFNRDDFQAFQLGLTLPDTRVIRAAEFRPGVSFEFSPENSRANSPGRYVRARF